MSSVYNKGGWQNGATMSTSEAITSFSFTFNVPSLPTGSDNQTIYVWPGLQASIGLEIKGKLHHVQGAVVFQPVLAYGLDGSTGWQMWNTIISNGELPAGTITGDTDAIDVKEGDSITGTVTDDGTNYNVGFTLAGKSYTASANKAVVQKAVKAAQPYPAVGDLKLDQPLAILELWYPSNQTVACSDYPQAPNVEFTNLSIESTSGSISPNWSNIGNTADGCSSISTSFDNTTGDVTISLPGSSS